MAERRRDAAEVFIVRVCSSIAMAWLGRYGNADRTRTGNNSCCERRTRTGNDSRGERRTRDTSQNGRLENHDTSENHTMSENNGENEKKWCSRDKRYKHAVRDCGDNAEFETSLVINYTTSSIKRPRYEAETTRRRGLFFTGRR